jgi:hypothetical protein
MDHYHILQVDVTATEAQIRSAYRRMARVSHPDGTDRTADPCEWERRNRLMAAIIEAHRVLSDATLRSAYDAELRMKRNSSATADSGASDGVRDRSRSRTRSSASSHSTARPKDGDRSGAGAHQRRKDPPRPRRTVFVGSVDDIADDRLSRLRKSLGSSSDDMLVFKSYGSFEWFLLPPLAAIAAGGIVALAIPAALPAVKPAVFECLGAGISMFGGYRLAIGLLRALFTRLPACVAVTRTRLVFCDGYTVTAWPLEHLDPGHFQHAFRSSRGPNVRVQSLGVTRKCVLRDTVPFLELLSAIHHQREECIALLERGLGHVVDSHDEFCDRFTAQRAPFGGTSPR